MQHGRSQAVEMMGTKLQLQVSGKDMQVMYAKMIGQAFRFCYRDVHYRYAKAKLA